MPAKLLHNGANCAGLQVGVILIMAWLAWERWSQVDQSGTLLAFIGALLFVLSDTILTLNRFHRAFKPARALNLATYFAAQGLIAGSVGAMFWPQ